MQACVGLFPSLNGSAKVTRQQLGLEGLLKANGVSDQLDSNTVSQLSSLEQPVTLYQCSFDASWELDLVGQSTLSGRAGGRANAGGRGVAQ